MAIKSDIERYQANYGAEKEGGWLNQKLAKTEQDPHLAELYRRLSETEQRQDTIWAERLRNIGQPKPAWSIGRLRLTWLAQRFDTSAVLPIISTMERGASREYDAQPEARAAGMQASERSHACIFRTLQTSTRGGIAGPVLAKFEGRHRNTAEMLCGRLFWGLAMA